MMSDQYLRPEVFTIFDDGWKEFNKAFVDSNPHPTPSEINAQVDLSNEFYKYIEGLNRNQFMADKINLAFELGLFKDIDIVPDNESYKAAYENGMSGWLVDGSPEPNVKTAKGIIYLTVGEIKSTYVDASGKTLIKSKFARHYTAMHEIAHALNAVDDWKVAAEIELSVKSLFTTTQPIIDATSNLSTSLHKLLKAEAYAIALGYNNAVTATTDGVSGQVSNSERLLASKNTSLAYILDSKGDFLPALQPFVSSAGFLSQESDAIDKSPIRKLLSNTSML
jgi:hypothetical protein